MKKEREGTSDKIQNITIESCSYYFGFGMNFWWVNVPFVSVNFYVPAF
jgi:hypothetical protein